MPLTGLSQEDINKVVTGVTQALQPQATTTQPTVTPSNHETIEAEPNTKAIYDVEAELIKQLANPKLVTTMSRGRSRTTNMTAQALDQIHDIMKRRKLWKYNVG
jgi:hypothetical protein